MERKPEEVHGVCRLIILIRRDGPKAEMQPYDVTALDPDPSIGRPAIRLKKLGGESFDIILSDGEHLCECPDFRHRRQNRDPKGCKHIAGLRKVATVCRAIADLFKND